MMSLPDRFGNAVISQWLLMQGRSPDGFTAIERLCYTGSRGMGALEYVPANGPVATNSEVDLLAEGKNMGLSTRFCNDTIARTKEVTGNWMRYAEKSGIREDRAEEVRRVIIS